MGSVDDFEEFFKNYVQKYSSTTINSSGDLLSVIASHRASTTLNRQNRVNSVGTSNVPLTSTRTSQLPTGSASSNMHGSNTGSQVASGTMATSSKVNTTGSKPTFQLNQYYQPVMMTPLMQPTQPVKRSVDQVASTQGQQKKTKLDVGVRSVTISASQLKTAINSPQSVIVSRSKSVIVPPSQPTAVPRIPPATVPSVPTSQPTTVPPSQTITVPRITPAAVPPLPPFPSATVPPPKLITVPRIPPATVPSVPPFSPSTVSSFQSATISPSQPTTVSSAPKFIILRRTSNPTRPNPLALRSTSTLASHLRNLQYSIFPPLTTGPFVATYPNYLPQTATHPTQSTSQIRPPPPPTNTTTPVFQYVTPEAYEVLKLISPCQFTLSFLDAGFFKADKVEPNQAEYNNVLEYICSSQPHSGFRVDLLSILKITQLSTSKPVPSTSTATSSTSTPNPEVASPSNRFKMMLWHGTKPISVASILKNGFRCPQAGRQMFGSGVYFADRISKSAQYCNPDVYCAIPKPGEIGYLFLCEVTLGKCYNAKNVKKSNKSAPTATRYDGSVMTFDSLKCTGENIPNIQQQKEIDGVIWPLGRTVKNTRFPSYSVLYNEFVVYNPEMVKIKYLVKVEFK